VLLLSLYKVVSKATAHSGRVTIHILNITTQTLNFNALILVLERENCRVIFYKGDIMDPNVPAYMSQARRTGNYDF